MVSLRTLRSALLALTLGLVAAPVAAQSGSFGNGVAIDGDDVIVSEPNTSFRPGTVYVYRQQGTDWRAVQQLRAPDAERADGFGATVAVGGNTLFVAQRGGRIHAFERDGGTWAYASTIDAGDREGLDPRCNAYGYCGAEFGISLATDGSWLFVGEQRARTDMSRMRVRQRRGAENEPPPPAGTVYAFQRADDGAWVERQRLSAPSDQLGNAFGASIAMAGGLLLVGAPGTHAGAAEGTGVVHVFRADGGGWQSAGSFAGDAETGAAFGTALAMADDRVLVGAPGAVGSFGAAYVFERDGATSFQRVARYDAPGGEEGDVFGAAVAMTDSDMWIGAPVSRGIENGMAFAYGQNGEPQRFRYDEFETNTEDSYGHRVTATSDLAAVTAAGLDHQAGGVFLYERGGDGTWSEAGRLVSAPDALGAVTGEERRCPEEGAVELFDCSDIELLSYIPISLLRADGNSRGVRANDNWGWTDSETGREYALVGRNDGTSFIDISDPLNPVLIGDLPKTPNTPRSQLWRDIKTYEDHAYIVADGAGDHGMQVFDLRRLRDVRNPPVVFEPDLLYRGDGLNVIGSSHNVIINEETGFGYLTDRGCAGMHIIDIKEPLNPQFVGCSEPGSTHDAQCIIYRGPDEAYQGREICLRMAGNSFQISDVTDKANPVQLSQASHPNPAYMHQGWVTEDHEYFIMDDESDVIAGSVETTRTLIWDLRDLEDPVLAKEFMGSMPASAHNLYVRGDFTYQANYKYGLHILDTSDPLNPVEVGHFDTSPYQTGPGFVGAWSTYPFFESGSIIVTSMQEGLFVLKKRSRPIS